MFAKPAGLRSRQRVCTLLPADEPAAHWPSQVLRLPMSIFDSQPAGRLLNRFSQDTEATDVVVRETIAWCLTCVGEAHSYEPGHARCLT